MTHSWSPAQLAEMADEFDRLGYLVVRDALDADEVSRLNLAVDKHWRDYPDDWISLSDSFCEGTNILPHTADFDHVLEHPKMLPILLAIMGENITFEEFAIMLRNPTANLNEVKGWHRDLIREFDRRHEIDAVSIMYYLTAVSETDHCFSIVPESHNRLVDLDPKEVPLDAGVDCIGPAGTAVFFHGRCIHNARLKQNSTQRRTLQSYYSNRLDQRTNEWTQIPSRLYEKQDPHLPSHFYSKWKVTNILDGVGKRPADIPPDAPLSTVIKEVQRRAKQRM